MSCASQGDSQASNPGEVVISVPSTLCLEVTRFHFQQWTEKKEMRLMPPAAQVL